MYSSYWNHFRPSKPYFCDICKASREMLNGLEHKICAECGCHPDLTYRCEDDDCCCVKIYSHSKKRRRVYNYDTDGSISDLYTTDDEEDSPVPRQRPRMFTGREMEQPKESEPIKKNNPRKSLETMETTWNNDPEL